MSQFGSARAMGAGIVAALVVATAAWIAAFGDYNGDSGGLAQKAGLAGCLSVDGSGRFSDNSREGECAVGTALGLPSAIVLSPDDRNAYVPAHREAVAVLDRDRRGVLSQKPGLAGCHSNDGTAGGQRARLLRQPPQLGRARACTQGRALLGLSAVALSPDGRHVYAGSADGVAIFDRRAATGALTQKPGRAGCVSRNGRARGQRPGQPGCGQARALYDGSFVAVSPDGRHVYVKSVDLIVFDRDVRGGELSQRPGRAGCIAADGEGAGRARCAAQPAAGAVTALAFSSDGRQAYASSGADTGRGLTIFDRDPATGALAQKPGRAGCIAARAECTPARGLAGAASVALSPDGANAYVVSFFGCAMAVFERDRAGGALTQKPGSAGVATEHGERGACDNRSARERRGRAGGSVTISPDGASAFISAGAGVAMFDRDLRGGRLRYRGCVSDDGESTCEDVSAFRGPDSPAVSADGRNLYVAASDADAIAVFDRPRPRGPG